LWTLAIPSLLFPNSHPITTKSRRTDLSLAISRCSNDTGIHATTGKRPKM